MSSYGRYYRPALKNSVDVQLQTAFNEGLWPTVVRLAAQRHKTKKDPYYEVGWSSQPLLLHLHLRLYLQVCGFARLTVGRRQ